MQFTPFIGLSVIIHLCVIASHKFFSRFGSNKEIGSETSNLLRVLSLVIVSGVFGVVMVNAILLLKASADDSHSVLKFAERHISLDK